MKLDIVVPVMRQEGWREIIDGWKKTARTDPNVIIVDNREVNNGVIASYQGGFLRSTAEIVAFFHDDLEIYEEGWDERVLHEFQTCGNCGHTKVEDGNTRIDPHSHCDYCKGWAENKVGVLGFGGALIHGVDDIYKVPYDYHQLGRREYYSNTKDAETHGKRFEGHRQVAVLDGYSLICRREFLHRAGGWPVSTYPPHHCYDYWVCCMAHKLGFSVCLLGIRCHHQGGKTATTDAYQKWAAGTKWKSDVNMHAVGHRLIYDDFREVLPWVCEGPTCHGLD